MQYSDALSSPSQATETASPNLSPVVSDKQHMEAIEKVLRRAEISRLTRNLKSRLALASFKTKRGWQDLDLDSIEPKVEEELENSSSAPNSPRKAEVGEPLGPPLGPPLSKGLSPSKRDYINMLSARGPPVAGKTANSPSPLKPFPGTQSAFSTTSHVHTTSPLARKRARTIDGQPASPSPIGGNGHGHGHMSGSISYPDLASSHGPAGTASSPPRTPPPRHRTTEHRDKGEHYYGTDSESADLLIFLANSPSPAQRNLNSPHSAARPEHHTPMAAPGTPSTQAFNFNEYLNMMTPSPAQNGAYGSPGGADRPISRSARRRLNFDPR